MRRSFGCGGWRSEAILFVFLYDCRHSGGRNLFDKVVIDERHGGASTAGEALDKLNAEFAVGRCGWCAAETMMLFVRIESHGLAEFFLHLVAAGEGAGECAADADNRLPGLLAAEPRIECDQFEDVHWREVELRCDPFDAGVVDKSKVILPQVQQRQGSAALGDRIVGNEFLRLGGELWRDGIRLTRGGVYHGRHLSEVGASASSKSIPTARHLCVGRVNLRLDPRLKCSVSAPPLSRHAVVGRHTAAEKWGIRDDAPPRVTKGAAAPIFQL